MQDLSFVSILFLHYVNVLYQLESWNVFCTVDLMFNNFKMSSLADDAT